MTDVLFSRAPYYSFQTVFELFRPFRGLGFRVFSSLNERDLGFRGLTAMKPETLSRPKHCTLKTVCSRNLGSDRVQLNPCSVVLL